MTPQPRPIPRWLLDAITGDIIDTDFGTDLPDVRISEAELTERNAYDALCQVEAEREE